MTEPLKRRTITPSQLSLFVDGHAGRWTYLTLSPLDNVATFREDTTGWGTVQRDQSKRVRPGDLVTLISHDGLVRHDACVVEKIEADRVWLGRPLRVQSFEPQALYSDGKSEVIAEGAGYAIRTVRDNRVEDFNYRSADAAKAEILRRQPTRT